MKTFASSLFALTILAAPAFAAGSQPAPATTTTSPATAPTQLHCKTGEVVKTVHHAGKPDTKECVKITGSNLSDPELYAQGWLLAKTGQYDWAIQVLSAVQDKNNPDVMNMLGYSNRKAGRLDVGISYYAKALELKPDFVRAREYLGEGLVAAGHTDQAKLQLGEIAKICGTDCAEYQDLQKVINGDNSEAL